MGAEKGGKGGVYTLLIPPELTQSSFLYWETIMPRIYTLQVQSNFLVCSYHGRCQKEEPWGLSPKNDQNTLGITMFSHYHCTIIMHQPVIVSNLISSSFYIYFLQSFVAWINSLNYLLSVVFNTCYFVADRSKQEIDKYKKVPYILILDPAAF